MIDRYPLAAARTALGAAFLLVATAAGADSHGPAPTGVDEDTIAERVTERVMEELRESGFLQEEIRKGIERFVREQREARARARAGQARADAVRRPSPERDHVRGDPAARVSLIEYSDFECPYCKRFHPTAMALVEGAGGEVNWVYRHFPLSFHNPLARKEAEASECAAALGGNDAFWRYADAIYERTRSNGDGFPMAGLVPLAGELGLDADAFRECLDSGRFAARVEADLKEGSAIGIRGTPGNVLIDNRTGRVRVLGGAVPLERLRAEVDALLSQE